MGLFGFLVVAAGLIAAGQIAEWLLNRKNGNKHKRD